MRRILFIATIFCSITPQCTTEEITSRAYPRIETSAVTDVGSSGATFHANIFYSNSSISDHGFIWSTQVTPTMNNSDSVSLGAMQGIGEFSATITQGLIEGDQIYARGYVRSSNYLVLGNIVRFTSKGSTTPYLIHRIVPDYNLMPHDTVIVYSNIKGKFGVNINGKSVDAKSITHVSKGRFTVMLPSELNQQNALEITANNKSYEARVPLTAAFSKIAIAKPALGEYYNNVCTIGKKSYFGLGMDSLFAFDEETEAFTFVSKLPVPARTGSCSFTIDGMGYFGGGESGGIDLVDFYSIDPATDKITLLSDLDGDRTIAMFSFGKKGYRMTHKDFGSSVRNEIFEFDPTTNEWTQKADFPSNTEGPVRAFEADGKAYITRLNNYRYDGYDYTGSLDLWSYDAALDKWTKVADPHVKANKDFGLFTVNNNVYVVRTYTVIIDEWSWYGYEHRTDFPVFDPAAAKFIPASFRTNIPFNVTGAFTGVDAAYIFNGNELWKFNPR